MNEAPHIGIELDRLLEVTVQDSVARRREIVVTMCRHVVVENPGGDRGVAIEIGYDVGEQDPQAFYFCPVSRLVSETFLPSHLKKVRPYVR